MAGQERSLTEGRADTADDLEVSADDQQHQPRAEQRYRESRLQGGRRREHSHPSARWRPAAWQSPAMARAPEVRTSGLQHESAQVALGPVHRCMIVRLGDFDQLALGMRAATSLWGGERFPLMPVSADGLVNPWVVQLLKPLAVSEGYDFSETIGGLKGLPTGFVVRPARPFEEGRHWQPPPIVAFDTEALRATRLIAAADAGNPFLTCALGSFADPAERSEWDDHGAQVSVVEERDLAPAELVQAQLDRTTALSTTTKGAFTYSAEAPFAASVGVLHVVPDDEASFEDLTWFWNLRAMRPGEAGLSVLVRRRHLQEPTVRSLLRDAIADKASGQPSVNVQSLSLSLTDLGNAVRGLRIKRHKGKQWTETWGARPRDGADPTLTLNTDMRQFWLGSREIGLPQTGDLWIDAGAAQLRFNNELKFAPAFTGAMPIRVRLRSAYLNVPQKPTVAQLFLDAGGWEAGALCWNSHLQAAYDFRLRMPSADQILRAATATDYETSDKGRELLAISTRMGDLSIFRQLATLRVIEVLTPDDSRRLRSLAVEGVDEQRLLALVNAMGERRLTVAEIFGRLRERAWRGTRDEIAGVLDGLVRSEVVERGLQVDCDLCSLRAFTSLSSHGPTPRCSGCGTEASYKHDRGEPQLVYRLNSLMQRVSANGGLAMLPAIALLRMEGAFLIPGVAFASGDPGELDLLAWSGSTVMAGEAKMTAASFTDVAHDVAQSARIGADTHVAICPEPLPEVVREELQSATSDAKIQLRILDAELLF